MLGFERKRDFRDFIDIGATVTQLSSELDNDQLRRLTKCKENWNFYEGYHWEDMPDVDTPEVTVNYCQAFVNKFVAFESGKGFTIETPMELDTLGVTINNDKLVVDIDENENGEIDADEKTLHNEPKTVLSFLMRFGKITIKKLFAQK